jgi:FkbM family methyltransferase
MSGIDRRSALLGAVAGAGIGLVVPRTTPRRQEEQEDERLFNRSYAQQGEDLAVASVLQKLGIREPTYLDIGAHHPIKGSNTYVFYEVGCRGVLVEPNPHYAELIRKTRPRDVVLEVGIGVTNQAAADYYVIRGDGQLNTFSKEQAEEHLKIAGPGAIERVIQRPLVPINDVLTQHFSARPPDFVSMDIEGLDFDILKTLDFDRWRPPVFCIETAGFGADVHEGILGLMEQKAYALRGGSLVNSVFVERSVLSAAFAR